MSTATRQHRAVRRSQGVLLAAVFAAGVCAGEAGLADPPPVVATPLTGGAVSGGLTRLAADGVVVETNNGRVEVSRDALPLVAFQAAPDSDPAAGDGRVWFVDGSTLPLADVESGPEPGQLALTLPEAVTGEPLSMTVRLDAVHAVLLPGAAEGFDSAWEDLRARGADSDLLVTAPRGGGLLDYVEGVVDAIDDATVVIELDGELIPAPRKRVFGLVFAATAADPVLEPVPRVDAAAGARLMASRLSLSGGLVRVETAAGLELSLPADRLRAVDYRAGRVEHLGDLAVESSRLAPLFGQPRGVSPGLTWPAMRVDRSYWNAPLAVRDPSAGASGLRVFERGIALRSGGEVAYRVDRRFDRLLAVAALDPNARENASVTLVIEADGRAVFEAAFDRGSTPVEIDLPLGGVHRLLLRAEREAGLEASVHLGDARLIR